MYKRLQLIDFTKLSFWDFDTLNKKKSFSSVFEIVKLKEVITLKKRFFLINDQYLYKRCRVQLYGNGVILRDQVFGTDIKTKRQQVCKIDDFIVAEIDAKFGGYGIIPKDLDGAIVSSHYFLFDINTSKLLPAFLELILKTDEFANQVKATGSTNYAAIRPYHVLEYEIPLPDLRTQTLIIKESEELNKTANEFSIQADHIEQVTNEYLLKKLGITFNTATKSKGFSVVNFSDVERWSVDFFRDQQVLKDLKKSPFPLTKLRQVINGLQYGLSLKAETVNSGIPMLRMNNVKKGKLDVSQLKYINISVNQIRNYILDSGDLLINRTNSKELVGKTAVFDLDTSYTFASYLIRIKVNPELVNVYFINYLFNSEIGRKQIDLVSRQVSGQANINSVEIQNFVFPIPDLNTQESIVNDLDRMAKEIASFQSQNITFKELAINTFKEKVFS